MTDEEMLGKVESMTTAEVGDLAKKMARDNPKALLSWIKKHISKNKTK